MAYTTNNEYLLNIVPTFNTVQNANGVVFNISELAESIANISEIVNYNTKSIYINTLYPYTTDTPIILAGSMTINGILEVGATQGGGICLQVGGDTFIDGNVSANSFITTSDKRYKKDIVPLSNALSTLCCLQGVQYTMNNSESSGSSQSRKAGLLAQDVHAILPYAVDTSDSSKWGIDYIQMIPLLIEAIKELSITISR